jgi:hypothetical protein
MADQLSYAEAKLAETRANKELIQAYQAKDSDLLRIKIAEFKAAAEAVRLAP